MTNNQDNSHFPILQPKEAYNLSAQYYDNWKWQKFWRLYEYPIIRDMFERAYSEKRADLSILDVGCGTGWYLDKIGDIASTRLGIDISEGMLSLAKTRLKNVFLKQENIENYEFRRNRYDIILATRVMSHIENPTSLIVKLRGSLVNSGWLILSDVDATHNYVATKLPTGGSPILAATFKHDRRELFSDIERMGFVNMGMNLIAMDGTSITIKRFRDHSRFKNLAGWVAGWRKTLI